MPFTELESHLHRVGVPVAEAGHAARPGPVVPVRHDRDFGARLLVRTPEGLLLKIGECEPM